MVDTLVGYPQENTSPTLRKRLYVLFKSLEGRKHTSPRNKLIRQKVNPYTFSHVDLETKEFVIIQSNKRPLYLPYWRFLHVIDMLEKSNGDPIHIESSNFPKREDTVEGSLMKRARKTNYFNSRQRTAAIVCDVLELGGFCEYTSMINPHTGRTVVGIQKL